MCQNVLHTTVFNVKHVKHSWHNSSQRKMATHFPINALPSSQFLQSTSRCRQKRRSTSIIVSAAKDVNKGLGVLEWTGAVVPQGLLVKGTYPSAPTTTTGHWTNNRSIAQA